MADVFISYSREDRPRVALIAAALEVEGLSVWWDPEILPGTIFDEVIDRELEAASCVIVAWSETSRRSRWVREEANDGLQQDILIPVLIDAVPLPRGFKLVQTEDLVEWSGDRNVDAWQRIMLQVRALVGKPEIARSDASTLVAEPLTAVTAAETDPPAAAASTGTGLLTITAAIILAGTWFYGTQQQSPLITGTVALAALAFVLFRFAESDLSPAVKAIASRWFLPVEGKVHVSAIEAFSNMFEAVFGRQHLSWKCLWRSAVASSVAIVTLFVIADLSVGYGELIHWFKFWNGEQVVSNMLIFSMFILANVIGDYLSLWETRVLLRFAARNLKFLVPVVLLDAVLTPAILLAALLISGFGIGSLLTGGPADELPVPTIDPIVLSGVSIATAYITSVWLWLALLFAPVARLLVWSRSTGLTTFGRIFDAERKPFTALGYVMALLILIIGGSIWGVTQAMATLG